MFWFEESTERAVHEKILYLGPDQEAEMLMNEREQKALEMTGKVPKVIVI